MLRRDIARLGIGFVILDHYGNAAGADPESPGTATAFLEAVRSFGPHVTKLLLSHPSKAGMDQRRATPFGSIFMLNARSVWEVRRAEDAERATVPITLYHTKVNDEHRHAPIPLLFTFETERITVTATTAHEQPDDLRARATVAQQLEAALANGPKTDAALAYELDLGLETVKRKLRAQKQTFAPLNDDSPRLWALRSTRSEA